MYNRGDDADATGRLSGLAAADAVLLRAAGAPARLGRSVRAVAGPVPRAAPDRTGPADGDEPARRGAVVRCVERHRAGRPARGARPGAAAHLSRRPPGQGTGAD